MATPDMKNLENIFRRLVENKAEQEELVASLSRELSSLIAGPLHEGLLSALADQVSALAYKSERAKEREKEETSALTTKALSKKSSTRSTRSSRSKRTAVTPDLIVEEVRQTPGLRVEELARKLKTPSPPLRPIMKELVSSGRLEKRGQARGTTYYPKGEVRKTSRPRTTKAKKKSSKRAGKKSSKKAKPYQEAGASQGADIILIEESKADKTMKEALKFDDEKFLEWVRGPGRDVILSKKMSAPMKDRLRLRINDIQKALAKKEPAAEAVG